MNADRWYQTDYIDNTYLMSSKSTSSSVTSGTATAGITLTNIACNLIYAGMRAQGSNNRIGRAVTFFFGFPGTLITYFAV
jgi:hypothetical protein